jgi:polar amino acid transport system substrate-binding protein
MKKTILAVILATALAVTWTATAVAGPVLDKILKKGELIVGLTGNQPPLSARNKKGKIIGMDVALAEMVATNMGVKLKLVTMPFSELLPSLEAGRVDMVMSGMTITPDRNLKVAFVGPYYISGKGVITKTRTVAALQNAEGLNRSKFRVAALKGSTSQKLVEKTAPKAKLTTTRSYDEAVEMLLNDKIDVVVADYPFCALTAYRYSDKGLIAGDMRLTYEPLGIAMKEDTLLINWMRNFITSLEGSGALDRLRNHWFNEDVWEKELP